jgi:hypothetical protein
VLLHEFVLDRILEEKLDKDRDAARRFLSTRLQCGRKRGLTSPTQSRVSPSPGGGSQTEACIEDFTDWDRFRARCEALVWLDRNRSLSASRPSYVEEAIASTIGRMRPSISRGYALILRPVRADGSLAKLGILTPSNAWDDIDVFWQCVFASLLAPQAIRQIGFCSRCERSIATGMGGPSHARYCEACRSAIYRSDPKNKQKNRDYMRAYQRALRAKQRKADDRIPGIQEENRFPPRCWKGV